MSFISFFAIVLVFLVFFHDVDLFVGTLSVDLLDMLLSLDEKLFTDVFHVSIGRSTLNFMSNYRIFHEDFILEKLFVEGHSFNRLDCHVNEF